MERYNEYKDSGVQWLGEIPEHWEMKRLKYLVSCNDESLTNAEDPNLEINYVEIGDVNDVKGITHITKYRFEDAPSRARRKTRKDDVIVSTVRTYLKAIAKIPEDDIIVSTGFAVLRAIDVNSSYLAFCCMSNHFVDSVVAKSKGISYPAITASELLNLFIPISPLSEQHSIVSYLDDKCGKIDKMLEGKQKQIELLAEMKQRIIADAVTHGLNPDVKMKATNIPWLPEIPEHWSCIKLKAFCKDNKEKNKGNIESCVLSLSYGNVIVKQNVNFGLVPDNYENYQIVKPGYIILRLTDLQNDHKSLRTGLVKNRGIITSAYVGLVVNNINYEYVHLLLHSYDVMKVFYGMGGGLRQSMSYQDISNLYIPVPPLSEQRTIVLYLDDKTAKIDTLTSKLQQEIESIKEYKQRLISDVVTGQIKVC